uniref:Uncharacterized protein n=1 Tax=Plectus sambesii TaxID=2011161 RepID=A0A914ULH1_9BILA
MARIILCLFLLSTPMIMTPMDFSDSESGIIRHDGLLTVSCPPGYVVCLQTMACVPEEEPFGDDRDSEAESQDFVFICGADEVYCMERRQCISTNDMQDGEQPPAGCSKMGAAKGKYTGGMQQPVIACSADQVFCSSERVCVEMNDYNPFTQPQASTTTATSAVLYIEKCSAKLAS